MNAPYHGYRTATIILFAAALLIPAMFGSVEARAQRSADELRYEPIAGNVYLISGGGGANISLSAGPDGVLLVDGKGPRVTRDIIEIAGSLSDEPIKFLINGHEHPDHTGGNENFGERGVTIVAHRAVREVLAAGQRGGPPAPPAALPVITFPDNGGLSFHFNGERIDVFHVAPAHAPGNSIVHYTGSNVLHVGDLFGPSRYPIIAGGTYNAFIEALNVAVRLSDVETRVVPGSGALSDREGLIAYRDMLIVVRDRVIAALDAGNSLEEFLASRPTREFDAVYGDPSHELFLPVLYEQMAASRN
jgi:cyclase